MSPDSPACVTCAASLSGPYCAACGQRVRPERLTLRGLLAEGFNAITSLDRGVARTTLDLVRRPAGLVRDYWRGQTVTYTGPARYFLLVVTLVQLAAFALGAAPEWGASFAEGFNEGRRTGAVALDGGSVADGMRRFWVVGFVGVVPLLTLLGRLVFHRAGRTVAEHAVAQFYLFSLVVVGIGLSLIVGDPLYDLWSPLGYTVQGGLAFGSALLYAWALGRTLGRTPWTGLAGGVTVLALGLLLALAGAGTAMAVAGL